MSEAARVGSGLGRVADYAPTYGALAALVLLLAVNSVFTTNFFDLNNFRNILLQVAPTVLVAVGMTLVMATGGIDLSVGSVMAIASAVAATSLDAGAGPALLLALAVAAGVGAFNGALISGFRIQPIIVTLALLISGRGVAQVISRGGQLIPFSDARFEYLGNGVVAGVPVQVIVMAAAVGLAVFAMRATPFGRYALAVGGNEAAARLAGVRVGRTKVAVYMLSGLLAGLAGVIETARLGAGDAQKVGLNMQLDAIAATVVGGTPLTGGRATVLGTLVGALIMQVITTGFVMNGISYAWSLVIKAAIIIVAVYIQRPKAA